MIAAIHACSMAHAHACTYTGSKLHTYQRLKNTCDDTKFAWLSYRERFGPVGCVASDGRSSSITHTPIHQEQHFKSAASRILFTYANTLQTILALHTAVDLRLLSAARLGRVCTYIRLIYVAIARPVSALARLPQGKHTHTYTFSGPLSTPSPPFKVRTAWVIAVLRGGGTS